MKVEGTFSLAADRQRAWELLQDPAVLARCMPGCQSLNQVGPDEYEMRMKMVLASIQGLFAGKVRIADASPPDSFRMHVDGSGKVGFLKGEGLLSLASRDGTTEVRYDGEVQVGGMIASVGQRLLENTARMLIRRFFDSLGKEAQNGASAAPPPASCA